MRKLLWKSESDNCGMTVRTNLVEKINTL
jgi:hypothetical protein